MANLTFISGDPFKIDKNSSCNPKGIAFSDLIWEKPKIPTPSTFSVLWGHRALVTSLLIETPMKHPYKNWYVILCILLLTGHYCLDMPLSIVSLLTLQSLHVTLDLLVFTCCNWQVTLEVSIFICHSWSITLDMSLLTYYSWHGNLDKTLLTFYSNM